MSSCGLSVPVLVPRFHKYYVDQSSNSWLHCLGMLMPRLHTSRGCRHSYPTGDGRRATGDGFWISEETASISADRSASVYLETVTVPLDLSICPQRRCPFPVVPFSYANHVQRQRSSSQVGGVSANSFPTVPSSVIGTLQIRLHIIAGYELFV